jgi:hypothetical protein
MDWGLIALLSGGLGLLVLRLWTGPAPQAPRGPVAEDEPAIDEPL